MLPLRLLGLAAALILAIVIIWAFQRADFWVSFAAITADPWGIVTLVDLYAGFLLFGAVIILVEKASALSFVLVALTLVLGNVVPGLWLAFRATRLAALARAST